MDKSMIIIIICMHTKCSTACSCSSFVGFE